MPTPDLVPDLERLLAGDDLGRTRADEILSTIMGGEVEPAVIAALLTALRAKGESADEIAGFVDAMRRHATPVPVHGPLLDTCGTGGDGAGTFNISTLSALVVAACGVRVAKHGNRAASSPCGSADLLEAWGVAIELPAAAVAATIDELGIGFLFARAFHPAMRHVAPVRRALGVRTVFNVLGPLSNPARATHQIVGVADPVLAPRVAAALATLGVEAVVFRGEDGLDELTTTGPSRTWRVRDGEVSPGRFDPTEHGVPTVDAAALRGGGIEDNLRIADQVLAGAPGPAADIVAVNAAVGLELVGAVRSVGDGIERAREALRSGATAELRDRWVARSQELAKEHADG